MIGTWPRDKRTAGAGTGPHPSSCYEAVFSWDAHPYFNVVAIPEIEEVFITSGETCPVYRKQSALGKSLHSWGVTRFQCCPELRVEATDQAAKSLFPAQGFVLMSFCILFKSAVGHALHLIHLPATSNVAENSPPETSVHKFSVKLSASLSPVIPGFPLINSSPLTEAFRVNWLSDTDFEVSTILLPIGAAHKEGS
ncbi:hypothetical protein J1605_013312 [Eschrichtius robustus]|uniref:Uncharacterized protein n=1 Tax=Eschrichtius robustus TaxID=9764 RepID=A0AB34GJF2_ESCRO|nr:hypothetical protein J1605_013312 [Eschrichtius robustus]